MTTTFGLFNTSVMGMSAQSDALSSISENISNSGTVGYKNATTEFETLLNGYQLDEAGGGVKTTSHYRTDAQGALQNTTSDTDLAVKGNGFFIVSNDTGDTFLTRAGSFVVDSQGRLVNSAGYYLKGFPSGGKSANDIANLEVIKIRNDKLIATASTKGTLSANLDSGAKVIAAANLPSTNSATAQYSSKTSVTVYDNLGAPVVLDMYFSKTASNSWEMSVYNAADAAAGGGFPYANPSLLTQTLAFDPTSGALSSGSTATLAIPNGKTLSLDLGATTQLSAKFAVNNVDFDGNAPSAVSRIEIEPDGTLNYLLAGGAMKAAYDIPLGRVNSSEKLTSLSGNVFSSNPQSGQIFIANPKSEGVGSIIASSLESSTVDLSSELSSLIVAQRSFTANSQVFQIASDVLQVLNNLK